MISEQSVTKKLDQYKGHGRKGYTFQKKNWRTGLGQAAVLLTDRPITWSMSIARFLDSRRQKNTRK